MFLAQFILREQEGIWINSVEFGPDGLLASGSDDSIKLCDLKTRNCSRTLNGHANSVSSVAFGGADGLLASGSRDNTIKLWNSTTG